ncbi:MAG: hypothetical protein DDT19_01797 [Syntrophomonadaceae bacterium]|nr:hypothetical protein [Bacillota bacterium]
MQLNNSVCLIVRLVVIMELAIRENMRFKEKISRLKDVEDKVKKRALFTAAVSEEIFRLKGVRPIVVGGEALEIYSQGNYTTGDIDLKAPKDILDKILRANGFNGYIYSKKTKSYYNKELDIFVEWVGASLEEGAESEKRTMLVNVSGSLVRLIPIEDLIIDRINAAKFWKDADSERWAEFLFLMGSGLNKIDMTYLRKRACEEDVGDALDSIVERTKNNEDKDTQLQRPLR